MLSSRLQEKLIKLSERGHYTFLVDRNKILSVGQNSLKTHTQIYKWGFTYPTIHSECDAILKLGFRPDGLKLINTRRNNRNEITISKPCKFCSRVIQLYNFSEVWYTDHLGEFRRFK